jgi:hypothetical protein
MVFSIVFHLAEILFHILLIDGFCWNKIGATMETSVSMPGLGFSNFELFIENLVNLKYFKSHCSI